MAHTLRGAESWNAGLNFADVVVAMRLKEIGVSHSDIGDILGISQSTVSSLGKEGGRYQKESEVAKLLLENPFNTMLLIESHVQS